MKRVRSRNRKRSTKQARYPEVLKTLSGAASQVLDADARISTSITMLKRFGGASPYRIQKLRQAQ